MKAEAGTTVRRRGGRRTKEAWRKNVDMGDVEEFLEDQRLEERLGKFSEKSDGELFTVDTAGDRTEPAPPPGASADEVRLSTKQRRRAALAAAPVPRCYQVLLPTSKVEDPNKKRNTVRIAGARPTALSHRTAARRATRGTLARKLRERRDNEQRARAERLARRTSRARFQLDVWTDVTEAKRVEEGLQSEWLSAETVQMNVACARRVPRPPRAPPLRPPPPPLQPPHPGQSYNPSYQDHRELLRLVCEKEQQLMQKEKHLERVTTAMFHRVRSDKAQTEWLQEMMAGLPAVPTLAPPGAGAPPNEEESDSEYAAVNPPVANRKKDNKARRKQRERKQELEVIKKRKVDKKKIADIYKLRFLEGALARAEERLVRVRELKATRRSARRAAAPPALNAHKHRPHEEDFLAPHELAPALRAHTPNGNLLQERFESLQRRGVLAPSRLFLRKKLRLKRYYKPGHKVTRKHAADYAAAADTHHH